MTARGDRSPQSALDHEGLLLLRSVVIREAVRLNGRARVTIALS